MEDQPVTDRGRRCPSCGALASEDATWCGQCFASLQETSVEAVAPTAPSRPDVQGSASVQAVARTGAPALKVPSWPCPTCGHDNAIERATCAVCGTSFADLMRMDERPPDVDPTSALLWSLVFPGLGHRKVGRPIDGFARGVLFAMLAGLALLIALTGVSTGLLSALLGLFVVSALAVYLGSAYEAYRLAQGGEPLVSPRALMWTTVAVVMLSVLLLAMSVITTTRR